MRDGQFAASVIEELYYDFARNRRKVYLINFNRGLCFGFGVFLGGTVVVAIITVILAWLANWFPTFSDFFTWLIDVMSRR